MADRYQQVSNGPPLRGRMVGREDSDAKFIDLFDGVFILDVDLDTLNRRLDERADEFGHVGDERELVLRLHRTQEDVPPDGVAIDAAAPVSRVVDDILAQCAR